MTIKYRCDICDEPLGPQHSHNLTLPPAKQAILCGPCRGYGTGGDSRAMHAKVFPDCSVTWHDMWDHTFLAGTRAATRWALDKGTRNELADNGYEVRTR